MDPKVDAYINKQKSPQKEICQHLRELIHKTLPSIKEEMKWGVPVFAGGKFYIGAMKERVHLGFAIGGLSAEEFSQFEGSGKTMRHLKIESLKDIDEVKITKLLKLVDQKATCEDSC